MDKIVEWYHWNLSKNYIKFNLVIAGERVILKKTSELSRQENMLKQISAKGTIKYLNHLSWFWIILLLKVKVKVNNKIGNIIIKWKA